MQAATLTAVVVLPTPPFWFAMAYTMPIRRPTLAAVPADLAGRRPATGVLMRFQRRVFADSGRFVAMPARRGNPGGVGATLRTTCRVLRSEPRYGTVDRAGSGARPRCPAAARASAISASSTAPFQATSTPPERRRGAAYSM